MMETRAGRGRVAGFLAALPSWRSDLRATLYQVLTMGAVLALGWYLVSNTLDNLHSRNIATGFSFLGREAGFPIAEHVIDYAPTSTYGRAFLVGILNTLKVSFVSIVLASVLGVVIGIARLSSNWLIARLASVYIEAIRNIPLILQLFFWYGLILTLPGPRQAATLLPGFLLSNRGLTFPLLQPEPVQLWMLALFGLGVLGAFGLNYAARRRQEKTGRRIALWPIMMALIVGPALIAFAIAGAPFDPDLPSLRGFNIEGGGTLSPELFALVFGLTVYTAAFIAEIVRSGILAVAKGQGEAAAALGLKRSAILRLVVLPQALRVIVPPTTNQYLNLLKNSSLAVGIGYQEVVSIGNTTINQTGQAIEGIAMIMAVYLIISLSISMGMNWYNRRLALKER